MLLIFSMIFGAFPFCRGRKNNFAGELGFGMACSLAFFTGGGYILFLVGGGFLGKYLLYLPFAAGTADLIFRRDFWKEKILALQRFSPVQALPFLAGVIFFVLLFFLAAEDSFPCGWDPAFHAILAEKLLRTGEMSRNWLPFENIPLNYPQGIHLVTALYAAASGATVLTSLKILMLAFTLAVTLLCVGLGERAFPGRKAGLYAAFAYLSFGGMATAVNFWGWGGYPTFGCFLYFAALVFGAWHYPGKWFLFSSLLFLWGALSLTHCLALLMILLVMAVWSFRLFAERKKYGWKMAPVYGIWKKLFFSGVFAVLTFLPCLVFQYGVSGGVGAESDAFFFTEEPLFTPGMIWEDGAFLFPAGILGAVLYLWERRKRKKNSLAAFLLLSALTVFLVFLFLGYPFRKWVALPLTGKEFSILVPSRFMSFACFLLVVFAGFFLAKLFSCLEKFSWKKGLESAVLLLLCFWGGASFYLGNTGNFSTLEALKRSEELKKILPENAYLVVDPSRISYAHFLPYLLWKPCVTNPIPASEDRRGVRGAISLFLETPRENMDFSRIRAFETERNCKVYYAIIPVNEENTPVKLFPAMGK